MKMKKIKLSSLFSVIAVVMSFMILAPFAKAGTISDNFNDGNTDGWLSARSGQGELGNWRISNGVLVEDSGHDHQKFLLNGYPAANQSIETKILFHNDGYAGITVWYQDDNNWIDVYIYPGHFLRVLESVDGVIQSTIYPDSSDKMTWYTMRVDANSLTGELAIFLDGTHLQTHIVTTTHRVGLSGLNSGNAGGSFDDFQITSNELSPTNKDQCKNDGWKTFSNPSFKNQGDCVSFLTVEANK